MHPGRLDLLDRPPHADRIDRGRGRERADRDRDAVAAAGAVDHVGEQEGAALILGETALELPAHQRMQLGVLVDRPIDTHEQALRFERSEMRLEVERRTASRIGEPASVYAGIKHAGKPCVAASV